MELNQHVLVFNADGQRGQRLTGTGAIGTESGFGIKSGTVCRTDQLFIGGFQKGIFVPNLPIDRLVSLTCHLNP